MENIILIIGHGNYATGLKSSIELIAGKQEGVYAIDFIESDSDISLRYRIGKILEKHVESSVLIICDIVGGTPFKVAAEFVVGDARKKLVAGCNLSAILEVALQKNHLALEDLAKIAVNTTKNSVMAFEENSSVTDHMSEEDGI
ncbi:PTS sugar transporter subunit IIA [Caldanaerobacter subterraneus]|uniref:PTS EIIA type-4 domain-containing protein n=1 Tax=Caldanaerobacter subterraneus subsp. pacificus DSM 12653 TaxID=391606 RepID=A0A0F5PQ08_9THEO|nr:PTS fructose transporter subunit IIA [Caldanaerobacter subterraneus]KKC30757.1 hypothetical protein CDSM653_00181 [Caldanaerobacter subterraneus subsp. pacificus DSM 12653]